VSKNDILLPYTGCSLTMDEGKQSVKITTQESLHLKHCCFSDTQEAVISLKTSKQDDYKTYFKERNTSMLVPSVCTGNVYL
jgi:hypothetical protein